jgi:hypothetical protein
MASTGGSSSWLSAGEAALGGILSYEAGQSSSVPTNSGPINNPGVEGLYYGQTGYQPTVGAAPSSGTSTSTMLMLGALLLIGGLVIFKLAR